MSQLILFVDDDLSYMYSVVDRLEAEGFIVETKNHPDAALEWLNDENNRPSLLICDLMMFRTEDEPLEEARLSGFKLIDKIRKELHLTIPVVILSGLLVPEIQEQAKNYTRWVVTKPTSQSILIKAVREALGDHHANVGA